MEKTTTELLKLIEENEFDYKVFFNNIDKFSKAQSIRLIQKGSDNFDVFWLTRFYSEFFDLILLDRIKRIKYSDIDITFPKEFKGIDKMDIFGNNNLISYQQYNITKGKLEKKIIEMKFQLTETIEINYFIGLLDFFTYLEKLILNNASTEQLSGLNIINQEPEPLDLSDTSAVEKIIYLNELGIIDFLRTKPEFIGSTNLMATILSAITDVKAGTLQTSLNRLVNNDTADKNHPYRTKRTVTKVRQTLIDKNIKPKTS